MDWVHGLVVSGGELCAEVETANGQVSLMGLAELGRCGVPSAQSTIRERLDVHFHDFSPCTADEYLTHFGLQARTEETDRHQVFEVFSGGLRYLVPALAMMRALFRPASRLLPLMFSPSALERNCRLEYVDDELRVVVDAPWTRFAKTQHHGDCEGPLRWMMLHPSARKMADSVHQYAMGGLIAVDLPAGHAEVVFAGVQGTSAVLVTEVRLLSVVPSDVPDLPVADWAPRIDYVNRIWAEGRKLGETVSADVPWHPDGTYELTDDEWTVVGPILESERDRKRRYQHCQRKMLDGVLGKLGTGKSWRDSPYTVGDWRNAATTYRNWCRRGTFTQALEALRSIRSANRSSR